MILSKGIYKVFALLILIFCTFNGYAQKDSTKVYIYEPFKSPQAGDARKNTRGYENCISWNWSLIGRGVFTLGYEKALTSNLTVEVGAGLTYMDPFFMAFNDENQNLYDLENNKIKFGQYLEGSLRFYPTEGDLEGFYISPMVRYRKYNVEVPMQDVYYSAGYNITDFCFIVGSQNEHWFSGILVDTYFGVNYHHAMIETVTDNPTTSTAKLNKWAPGLMFGIKVGVPF